MSLIVVCVAVHVRVDFVRSRKKKKKKLQWRLNLTMKTDKCCKLTVMKLWFFFCQMQGEKSHKHIRFLLLSLLFIYLSLICRRPIASMFSDFIKTVRWTLNPAAPYKPTWLFGHTKSLGIESMVTAKTLARIAPFAVWLAETIFCPEHPFSWIGVAEIRRFVHVHQVTFGWIITAWIDAY